MTPHDDDDEDDVGKLHVFRAFLFETTNRATFDKSGDFEATRFRCDTWDKVIEVDQMSSLVYQDDSLFFLVSVTFRIRCVSRTFTFYLNE